MLFLFSVPALLLAGLIVNIMTNRPPQSEVMEARQKLAEAQFERAPKFAGEHFHQASEYYDSAMMEWKNQNSRFIVLRNYRSVSDFARTSRLYSEGAIQKSRETINDMENNLGLRLEHLGSRMENFDMIFGRFPMQNEHRDSLTRCTLLYTESLHAYNNQNYNRCKSKLELAESVFSEVSEHYMEILETYFEEFPHWAMMIEKSISYSKNNKTQVLVVDKIARVLYVYKNGLVLKEYPVELGSNWVGDKMQQGDKSTPEGHYRILEKKQNGQTRYHKAFLLNYPNEEDKKRYSANRKNGIIEHDASIGNLIEIHGSGGKGTDWTDGCIALQDIHMDELFALCPAGTRVTIVGSTKSLEELSYKLL